MIPKSLEEDFALGSDLLVLNDRSVKQPFGDLLQNAVLSDALLGARRKRTLFDGKSSPGKELSLSFRGWGELLGLDCLCVFPLALREVCCPLFYTFPNTSHLPSESSSSV